MASNIEGITKDNIIQIQYSTDFKEKLYEFHEFERNQNEDQLSNQRKCEMQQDILYFFAGMAKQIDANKTNNFRSNYLRLSIKNKSVFR